VRNIPGEIAGSKMLLATVYNTALVCTVCIMIITMLPTDFESLILIQIAGISLCVIMSSIFLVAPSLYSLMTVGDAEAADEVLSAVFSKKQPSASSSARGNRPRSHASSVVVAANSAAGDGHAGDTGIEHCGEVAAEVWKDKCCDGGTGTGTGTQSDRHSQASPHIAPATVTPSVSVGISNRLGRDVLSFVSSKEPKVSELVADIRDYIAITS
jgi:hypothetical protein